MVGSQGCCGAEKGAGTGGRPSSAVLGQDGPSLPPHSTSSAYAFAPRAWVTASRSNWVRRGSYRGSWKLERPGHLAIGSWLPCSLSQVEASEFPGPRCRSHLILQMAGEVTSASKGRAGCPGARWHRPARLPAWELPPLGSERLCSFRSPPGASNLWASLGHTGRRRVVSGYTLNTL